MRDVITAPPAAQAKAFAPLLAYSGIC